MTKPETKIIGYKLMSDCAECISERKEICEKKILFKKECCKHYNDYNSCLECEKESGIENGCCKHVTGKKSNLLVYSSECLTCYKSKELKSVRLQIKDNNLHECIHHHSCINNSGFYLNKNEFHDNCDFLVCKHNVLYKDVCQECNNYSEIIDGKCKHERNRIITNNIVYCDQCLKERGFYFKKIVIENNDRYKCKHQNINLLDGHSIGGFIDICQEFHEECEFYVCKHGTLYQDECLQCKNELIIGNKCIHNKKSSCHQCRLLNKPATRFICEHNIDIHDCLDCGLVILCCHNKKYSDCIKCDKTYYCRHNKQKRHCRICDGSYLCKNEWCESVCNKKYNDYCLRCFIHMFPDLPNVRNYKTKEKTVVERIINFYPDFSWVADKKIQDGCSKRRPDLLLDMGTHIIIVEVDENKHTDYDCSCEHKRLMELSRDVGHRPIIFIRFNPDEYVDKNGKKIKSCWKLNKNGIMSILSSKKEEWEERILALKNQIQYWIDNQTEKTIEIVELFY